MPASALRCVRWCIATAWAQVATGRPSASSAAANTTSSRTCGRSPFRWHGVSGRGHQSDRHGVLAAVIEIVALQWRHRERPRDRIQAGEVGATASAGPSACSLAVSTEMSRDYAWSPKRKRAHHRQEHECDSARRATPSPASRGVWRRPRGGLLCQATRSRTRRRNARVPVTPEATRTAPRLLSTTTRMPPSRWRIDARGRTRSVSCAGSRFRGRACAVRAAGTEVHGRRSAPPAATAGR